MTAVMIVLLALLNDGAILSIAYDRAWAADEPQAWNMRLVLGIATVMGVYVVATSFGILHLGQELAAKSHYFFGMSEGQFLGFFGVTLEKVKDFFQMTDTKIQGLVYLKLSVAGHMTVFCARTRGPWWSSRPSTILLSAVIATQVLATFIVVYGVFGLMPPIGWPLALLVWVYCLALFIFQDWVKLLAYKVFGGEHKGLLLGKRK